MPPPPDALLLVSSIAARAPSACLRTNDVLSFWALRSAGDRPLFERLAGARIDHFAQRARGHAANVLVLVAQGVDERRHGPRIVDLAQIDHRGQTGLVRAGRTGLARQSVDPVGARDPLPQDLNRKYGGQKNQRDRNPAHTDPPGVPPKAMTQRFSGCPEGTGFAKRRTATHARSFPPEYRFQKAPARQNSREDRHLYRVMARLWEFAGQRLSSRSRPCGRPMEKPGCSHRPATTSSICRMPRR